MMQGSLLKEKFSNFCGNRKNWKITPKKQVIDFFEDHIAHELLKKRLIMVGVLCAAIVSLLGAEYAFVNYMLKDLIEIKTSLERFNAVAGQMNSTLTAENKQIINEILKAEETLATIIKNTNLTNIVTTFMGYN